MHWEVAAARPGDGDLDGNGSFGPADARIAIRFLRSEVQPSSVQLVRGDVAPVGHTPAFPGSIDPGDVLLMLRAMTNADVDGDSLGTVAENALGTSPFLADTDGDGSLDATDPQPLVASGPGVPTNVRVVDAPGGVSLNWGSSGAPPAVYRVHRYGTDGKYSFIDLPGSSLGYVDPSAPSSGVSFYWVQAVNGLGQEGAFVDCNVADPANGRLWLTGKPGPLPNPHSGATGGAGTIQVLWEASNETAVVGYHVWIASVVVPLGATAGFSQTATVTGRTSTAHAISSLAPGLYSVRVTAFSAANESHLASAKQLTIRVD